MCNFMIQELNRGAVIFGLPDVSGKPRPMVLLNDIRPNDSTNYGMTINAFQISSRCYNKFELPIKLRWSSSVMRTSFIATMFTLQFSQYELLSGGVRFVGVIPLNMLDLACKIHTSYICGDLDAIESFAEDVFNLRKDFCKIYGESIHYKDKSGNTVEMLPNGRERIVQEKKEIEQLESQDISESMDVLGKRIKRKTRKTTNTEVHLVSGNKIIRDSADNTPHDSGHITDRTENVVTQKEEKEEKISQPQVLWMWGKYASSQSDQALIEFLNLYSNKRSVDDIRCMYNLKTNMSVYSRKEAIVKEVYKRFDKGHLKLSDSDMEILLKLTK